MRTLGCRHEYETRFCLSSARVVFNHPGLNGARPSHYYFAFHFTAPTRILSAFPAPYHSRNLFSCFTSYTMATEIISATSNGGESSSAMTISDEFPSSVEEAAALLGAAITRLTASSSSIQSTYKAPPTGMHSSFTVRTVVPSTELLVRLYQLRTLLRQHSLVDNNQPLVAAPSILHVLMQILNLSSTMAPSYLHYNEALSSNAAARPETPPLLSEALRHLWVDAVALCFVHGGGSSNNMSTTPFLRQMLAMAVLNPRSAKAAGGVRIAALQVVRALFVQMGSGTSTSMAPWSLDVLQVTAKALKSAGHGEPSYRLAALEAAAATATACRQAHLRKLAGSGDYTAAPSLVLAGAYEEKALLELTRILKTAANDKFPEVRHAAAVVCGLAVPLAVTSNPQAALAALDDWLPLCVKQLDDASSVFTSHAWASALARGLCTVLEYHRTKGGAGGSGGADDIDAASPSKAGPTSATRQSWLGQMRSIKAVLSYLSQQFVKAGGEMGAARMGGTFSSGGRAVRLGWTLTLVEFLRLVPTLNDGGAVNPKEWRQQLLDELLPPELEKQLKAPDALNNKANPLFASAAQRNWSKADAPLVRTLVARVFRQGLTEVSPEPVQIGLLEDWVTSLEMHNQASAASSGSSGKDEKKGGPDPNEGRRLNANQLQVALGEISHLIPSLGEAVSSKKDEILAVVRLLLEHKDTGVRFEAAVACTALVNSFPDVGLKLFPDLVMEIQLHHAELMRMATSGDSTPDGSPSKQGGLRMFRKKEKQVDSSAPQNQAIHGKSVLLSLLLRDLPQTQTGLPKDLIASVLPAAEVLVSCQFNETLTQAFPAAACVCVRAGFALISGIMSTGPSGVAPHIPMIFEAWKKCQQAAEKGGKHLASRHDLFCVDSLLVSIVVFLKYCSELLLTIPEALTHVSEILEGLLPLLTNNGRLVSIPLTPPVAAKLESTRASLLEAFAWLPAGSFPMAADDVFAFAAELIKNAVDSEVSCSILQELVNEEDSLLDVKTVTRASKESHSGGARDLGMSLIALESEAVHPAEQEAVMHLVGRPTFSRLGEGSSFQESHILGVFAKQTTKEKPPTPLHEVGAWRRPMDPCCSSKVRLIDAAIQAFSATFGLKSGKEQQSAMDMLESMVPPYYAQLARAVGVNAALTEQDRRAKNKEDSAAMTNITAVLLSCLQSLPLHEATHNVPISLGPPWMNKAKDLLLTLLPSGSNDIRRAAAEGLALLATLGVSEDAHFLQSKVLHSLDEVMQGNRPDAKVLRALPVESVAAARAGSLLTLACIQRTSSDIVERQIERARVRSGPSSPVSASKKKVNSELPVFQMITRILPSINYFGFRDYLVVRSYAIHAFAVLLAYSERLEGETLGPVERQLLEKAIELVEDNFCSSWMAASSDVDRGEEPEKMASETSLLSVLLRLMVFLAKHLHKVDTTGGGHARRFALIGHIILEKHRLHPYVVREVMALLEVLAPSLAAADPQSMAYPQEEMLRHTFACAFPETSGASLYGRASWEEPSLLSFGSARACTFAELSLSLFRHADVSLECDPFLLAGRCMALMERASASLYFDGARVFRCLAASARAERRFFESSMIRKESPKFLLSLVAADAALDNLCIRWILFTRSILSGPRSGSDLNTNQELVYTIEEVIRAASDSAESDAGIVVKSGNPSRTDVKAVAAQMMSLALRHLSNNQRNPAASISNSTQFNYFEAKKACQAQLKECRENNTILPESRLVFHLQELVTTICMSSNAALDHSELHSVQESSVYVLSKVIECFSQMDDPEVPDTKLLEQYAQQIFSSIKHALSSAEENSTESAVRVLYAGCNAVCSIVDNELTDDPAVVKRLLRSIVSSATEVPFVSLSDGKELFHAGKVNLSQAKLICEVWTTGQLFFQVDDKATRACIVQVKKDLLTSFVGLSTHFGLIAMEGARLLAASDLTLIGKPAKGRVSSSVGSSGGIFAACDDDMSQISKILILQSWSACCRSAICSLTEIPEGDMEDKVAQGVAVWLETMACLAIEGIEDSLPGLDDKEGSEFGLDASEVLAECLSGVLILVQRQPDFLGRMKGRVEHLLDSLCSNIVVPLLESTDVSRDVRVVQTTCKLILALAVSDIRTSNAASVKCLLTPLQFLEGDKINRDSKPSMILLETSLTGIASMISKTDSQTSFVQSILRLVLKYVFNADKPFTPNIVEAAKKVFVECFGHTTTSRKERGKLAMHLVEANEWDAWAVAFAADGGASTHKSLEKASSVLTDHASSYQLTSLKAILTVAQSSPPPNVTISCLMNVAGASVIELFYSHGTGKVAGGKGSTEACAGAMKIILISFMHLVSSDTEESEFAAFLGVVFGVFLAVIRYNGLPNHPSPQAGGDSSLGRLCAQAILHVAKTAPGPFKTCVATLAPHDRTLLEFAVRGEMTGYQVQGGTQEKKKLNLANFKK